MAVVRLQKKIVPAPKAAPKMVTPHSAWDDDAWKFDPVRSGEKSLRVVNWNVALSGGRKLGDPALAVYVATMKHLGWTMLNGHGGGKPMKASTVQVDMLHLAKLVDWMARKGLESFAELTSELSWSYKEDVEREAVAAGLLRGWVSSKVDIVSKAYSYKTILEKAGCVFFMEAPFGGARPRAGSRVDLKEGGWIPPLPDEVAWATLASACRWIGAPLSDIAKLSQELMEFTTRKRALNATRAGAAMKISDWLAGYQFSKNPDGKPWRGAIEPGSDISFETGKPIERSEFVVKILVNNSVAACACLIQGATGLRVGELLSIKAGVDEKTGLPKCIQIRKSKTGLNELMFVEATAEKIVDGQGLEWLVGMRPAGSSYIPPPVQAILALERLLAPWREMAQSDRLFVYYGSRFKNLATTPEEVSNFSAEVLNDICQAFMATCCGLEALPDARPGGGGLVDFTPYKSGKGFRSHQWRKTFALHVLRSDSRMLPTLAQHFKHMSLAMTEQGYIGNDPELLETIDSMRRDKTIRFLVEQSTGVAPVAGGMASLIEEQRERLAKIDASEGLATWVEQADLRIWFSDYGKCLVNINPGESRCHSMGGTNPWLSKEPNHAHRSPSVCGGCKCFVVDREHKVFWQDRLAKNKAVLDQASAERRPEYRVAQERVRQAKSILASLERKSAEDKQ